MLYLRNVWPELKVIEKLGEGSFGKVYKCEREELGMKLYNAVKVISIPANKAEYDSVRKECQSDAEVKSYYGDIVADFSNEIKLMLMLKGAPNVVSVENFRIVEHTDGIGSDIYICMEYLTCFSAYSAAHTIDEKEVLRLGKEISNALAICSEMGIIHRDIKPDNIFVDRYGSYKLGDFGVARRLEGSMSMMSKKGTYSYMAPEVFRGEKYDSRADIYSLGMVMYKLLNRNRDPFVDLNKPVVGYNDRNEAIERRRSGERLPAPVDASPAVAEVILKACEFNPIDRYASVAQFKQALAAAEENSLIEEPTVAARNCEEKTVASSGFDEQTVAVRDVTIAMPPWIQADFNDETVVTNNPTVVKEATVIIGDEATVMAMPVPDTTPISSAVHNRMTVVADKKENSFANNRDQKKKIKIITLIILGVIVLRVGVILLFGSGIVDDTSIRKSEKETIETSPGDVYNEVPSYVEEEYTEQLETEETLYRQAEEALFLGNKAQAAILFGKAANYNYSDARERSVELWNEVIKRTTIGAGTNDSAAIKNDGSVVVTKYKKAYESDDYDGCRVDTWSDIIEISYGSCHLAGLKADGTVVAVDAGGLSGHYDDTEIKEWVDIIDIAAGGNETAGLRIDGTVVSTDYFLEKDIVEWNDIIAISCSNLHIVGLKADGTVVASGYNDEGQCEVENWKNVVAVDAGYYHTVALTADGKVLYAGKDSDRYASKFGELSNIVSISTGQYHTLARNSSGKFFAVERPYFDFVNYHGETSVEDWNDIVAFVADEFLSLGLKSDGTVVAAGYNGVGQCDVDGWKNIKLPK